MSKLLQELSDVSNISSIIEVKFGLLNPDALKKASVCHVTIAETYDGNEPKENALFDPRMGILERGRICPTDDYDHTICPGYFGHIELPLPVYWIQHMDTIIKLLRCVCIRCANLLIDKSNASIMKELKKKSGANAFKYIADLCTKQSSKKCIYNGCCNAVQPTIYRKVMGDKYKNDNIIQIDAEYSADVFKDAGEKKLKFILPVEHVLNIFKKISNEDAELLGFDVNDARPEWMICTVVPVSPPAVRPSVRQDNNQRAEDDLTSKFAEIVKNVNLLKRELEKALKKDTDLEKESSARQINLIHNMIQYHVATLVDNEIKNIPVSSRRSGQPLKMIRQRLKGKEGRIRSNIMGKRVDFSGRTVVGVDPSISIDEYGVPMKIAMNLTIPETVTKYNKEKLYRFVRNGPNIHPGAKQITKMNYDENGIAHPEHIYLKYIDKDSIVLEDGDIIDRHLMDGDWGQFNRQPSLHRMSMMAHKVKVMPGKTFRLNVYCTAPYNADFDGDEMNTHIPQSIEAAYELEKLTAVSTQIISPAKSEPIIQVNFDTMVAAFLITRPTVIISKKMAYNLVMTNNQFTGKIPESKDGTIRGQDIYSMFLPDISFVKGNKSYDIDPSEYNKIVIDNGVFKQGILDKTIIGKTLIHMIYDSFGPTSVRNFLDNNQRMLNRWLAEYCFTLGMGDCIPTKEDNLKIKEFIEDKIKNVNTIIKEANIGIYNQNLDSKFIRLSLESDIKEQLDGAKYDFEKYLKKNIDKKNGMYIINNSGAKGDVLSAICQTRGFLGQTSIIGDRVTFGYDRRTLPHFSKDDYGAVSRGFIVNNFFNGLEPHELFFHQMGGRVGVIDTAIKSVSYDTTIIILEKGEMKYIQIGEWIDKHLDENKNEIEYLPEKEQELLKLKDGAYISTTNDLGNVSWGEITAITRHDPGKEMYKIYTESGRDVKVVESKSLIVWNEDLKKFIEKPTPEIKVGDYLPVTMNLKTPPVINIKNILSSSNEEIEEYLCSFNKFGENIFKISDYQKILPYLFSRIGVFTEINGNELIVYWNQIHNYRIVNDVILDSIVRIEKLSVLDYPKVYDITVPETLNFSLSNGLQVRDTAESGYMQRRLIKALEDLSVKYGGTVRNGINNIVQFAYGDDGIDPCKLNKQELKLIEYNNEEMENKYLIADDSIDLLKNIMTAESFKELIGEKDYIKKFREDYDKIIGIRDVARKSYFTNMNVMNAIVFCPIFFPRTIKNARDMFKIQLNKKTDLTPKYIRELLNELENELLKYLPDFSLNIFRALLYSNLSTKVSIIENKFNKTVFKFIIDTIREKYIKSFVQPGEMVGIIGAQSMGEPLTQMSVPADTSIIIEFNGQIEKTTIGIFIDKIIKNKNGDVFIDKTGLHTIMEVNDKMKILSVSHDEKIGWRNITKISRHPVNGRLMRVKTRTGRITRATLSHSFLKRTVNGIIPIEGSALAVGDRIPVTSKIPEIDEEIIINYIEIGGKNYECDELFGTVCGISSINFKANKLGLVISIYGNEIDKLVVEFAEKYNIPYEVRETIIILKSVSLSLFISEKFISLTPLIYQFSKKFISGYLSVMLEFYTSVQPKKMQIILTSGREFIVNIQNLLNYFGIFGIYDKNTMVITKKYIEQLSKKFKIYSDSRRSQIQEILDLINSKDSRVVIDYIDKVPSVGDLISEIGNDLKMNGNNRLYGRWKGCESIGRRTLEKYLSDFKCVISTSRMETPELNQKIKLLEQAVYSDVIWDEIVSIDYYDGDELEYVYDFTVPGSESFMVDDGIMVHNTLNSVEWNTEILLKINGELVKTKIGEWIDERIDNADPKLIEKHPNDTTLEYIKDKQVFIQACTEDGNIIWDEVEAVTKHPVINKDGSKTLLKITTENGREVIATKAKSFLKRVNNKIIGVDGDSIQIGDYLPVAKDAVNSADKVDKIGSNYNIIPLVNTLQWGYVHINKNQINDYILNCNNDSDKNIFMSLLKEDINYDMVINIEEVTSDYNYVYDLTVKNTRNFNIYNGLCMRDTFHNAGVGAKALVTSTGVPRIKEIINVAKTIKSPSMEIFLKDKYSSDISGAKNVCNYIEFTKLQDIVEKTMIIYENKNQDSNIEEDIEFIRTYSEFADIIGVSVCPGEQLSSWILRVIFNKEKMMNKNIYLSDIQDVIQRNSIEDEIQCIFSDDNAKELMLRIRIREDSYDGDYLEFLQELEKILMGITIRGIPNIDQVVPNMRKKIVYREDGSYNQTTEWYLETSGVNLLDVLINDKVDSNRTLSNDIHEINEIFGIEATRSIIIQELMKMDDYEVNYRHLSLLGDIMTHRGIIMPIERHGINRSGERGAIAKATFEESTEILVKASTFAEKDKMGGVSANIMFGQLPKVGTNAFDILFDETKFFNEITKMKESSKKTDKDVIRENIKEKIEEKLNKDYDDNLGDTIDSIFDFTVNTMEIPEKPMMPHILPETVLGVSSTKGKKKIVIKKK
jgi:DNA-directed RNA polymerase beta' subunit